MSQDVYLAVNYAYFGPSSNEKKFLCVCRFTRDVLALVGCHGDLRSLVGWTDFPKRFPNEFAAYARSIDLGSGPRALCVGPLDLHGSQNTGKSSFQTLKRRWRLKCFTNFRARKAMAKRWWRIFSLMDG